MIMEHAFSAPIQPTPMPAGYADMGFRELTPGEIGAVGGACSVGGFFSALIGGAVAGALGGGAAGAIFGPGAVVGAGAGAVSVGIANSVVYAWDNCLF